MSNVNWAASISILLYETDWPRWSKTLQEPIKFINQMSFGNYRTRTMLYNSKKFMIITLKHASKTSYFQDRILQHQEHPLYKRLARLNMCTPLPIPWIQEICQPLQAGFPLWELSCIETSIETVEPSLESWASITINWAYYPVRHLFTIHIL